MRRIVLFAAALMMAAAPALAHTPHTVDFNRGDDDSLTGRAPSQVMVAQAGQADDMAGMDHGAMKMNHDMQAAAPAKPDCAHAFDAGMEKMHHDMSVTPSGNADVDFARMMIPHHQGAIDMAKAELQCGHDPKLRKLATRIVAAQEGEIKFMNEWLASHKAAR